MKIYDKEVENPKRLFSLDCLRALAVTLVVICHIGLRYSTGSTSIFSYFGLLGVEIFFVLSGFLIGTIILKTFNEKEDFEFKQIKSFWVRRWFRTLPNYYLVLIILIIFYSIFYYHSFMLKQLSNLSFFIFLQSAITPHPVFFPVAWSLAIEEWFYLLFPLWLLIISKFNSNKYKTLVISVLSFILIEVLLRGVIASMYTRLNFYEIFYKMVPFRLDSIAIGVLTAMIYYYHKDFWNNNKIKSFILGIGLFLASSLYFYFYIILIKNQSIITNLFTNIFFLIFLNISLAFLFPLILSLNRFKKEAIAKFIIHISLISYSIYLIHYFIISGISRLPLDNLSKMGICLFLIFVISTIQYRFFEKPMTLVRERFSKSPLTKIK